MSGTGTDQAAGQIEAAVAKSGKVDQHVYDEINSAIETNGLNNPDGLNALQGSLSHLLPDIVIEDAAVQNMLIADGGISASDVDSLSTNASGADQLAAAGLKANFDNIDSDNNNDISEAELKAWRTGLNQRFADSQPSGTLDMQAWLGPQGSETLFMRPTGGLTQINGITNGAFYYQDPNSGQWVDAEGNKITAPVVTEFDGYQFGQFSFQYQSGPMMGSTVVHKTDNSEVTTNLAGQVQRVRYPNGDVRDFTYGEDGALAGVLMTPADGSSAIATTVTGMKGVVRADGTFMLNGDDGRSTRVLLTNGTEHSVVQAAVAAPDDTTAGDVTNNEAEVPTEAPVADPNAEASQTTAPDGSIVHLNAQGQPIRVDHTNGATTTFEYGADGQIQKIVPPTPDQSTAMPLELVDGKWVTHGTPLEGWSNVAVNPDGSYSVHIVDGGGEYDIKFNTDGSRVFTQGGAFLQIDRPGDMRAFQFNPPANPTEIKVHDGATTYVKTDAGWVNKDNSAETYTSIMATASGVVTFTRPDQSSVVYKTDGTQQEVAAPAGAGDGADEQPEVPVDYNTEASQATAPDGSIVHLNAQGQPIRVDHVNGTTTTFEYGADGQINKIVPPSPETSTAMPLERDGDVWKSNGTPLQGFSDVVVNADGSYSARVINGDTRYDMTFKTDGSTVFTQDGKLMQVDRPDQMRAFQFNPPGKPTEIKMNEGGTTYIKTDIGWVNKNDPSETYASISATADGTVTFGKADGSSIVYKTDGTRDEVAAPVEEPEQPETQTTTETLADGSIVTKDDQGRVVETKGTNGSTTKFTYDQTGDLTRVEVGYEPNNGYTETYRRNADGTWTHSTNIAGMPGESTSERVDKVEVASRTGALRVTTGDISKIEHVNGDDSYVRGTTRIDVTKDDKGGYASIVTSSNGQVVETLTKEGDQWVRTDSRGNKTNVDNVWPDGKGGYQYRLEGQYRDTTIHRNIDGSGIIDTKYKNGNSSKDVINPAGQLVSTTNIDKAGNFQEEVKYDPETGAVTEVKVFPVGQPDQAQLGTDVKREDNGGYSYTIGEGDAAQRITVNPDGSRVEGKLLADGTRQVTRVVHEEGDILQFEYDETGKISKVTQTFPPNYPNADGSTTTPRQPETWTPDPANPGRFTRSSDGMPGRDLQVDANGNFSYTYTTPDGKLMRHTETATGDNPEDVPVNEAGDKQYGDRTFHMDENGNAVYDIVGGDTLWWISSNILTGQGIENPTAEQIWEVINKIAAENGIADPNMIYAGAKLNISNEIMNGYRQPDAGDRTEGEDPPENEPIPDPYNYN